MTRMKTGTWRMNSGHIVYVDKDGLIRQFFRNDMPNILVTKMQKPCSMETFKLRVWRQNKKTSKDNDK